MRRVLQLIFLLAVLGFLALLGYAYVGDLSPGTAEQRIEVRLPGVTPAAEPATEPAAVSPAASPATAPATPAPATEMPSGN